MPSFSPTTSREGPTAHDAPKLPCRPQLSSRRSDKCQSCLLPSCPLSRPAPSIGRADRNIQYAREMLSRYVSAYRASNGDSRGSSWCRLEGVVSGAMVGSPAALPRSQRCVSAVLVVKQGSEEGVMSPGPVSGQVTDVVSLSYRPGEGPGRLPAPSQDSLHCAAPLPFCSPLSSLPSWSSMILRAQAPLSVSAAPPLHYTSRVQKPPLTLLYLDTKKQRRQTAAWRETRVQTPIADMCSLSDAPMMRWT